MVRKFFTKRLFPWVAMVTLTLPALTHAQTSPISCPRIFDILSANPVTIPQLSLSEKGAFFEQLNRQALDYLHGRCLSDGGVITCFASSNKDMAEQLWVRDNMIALNTLQDRLENVLTVVEPRLRVSIAGEPVGTPRRKELENRLATVQAEKLRTLTEVKKTLEFWKRFQESPVPVRENSQMVPLYPDGPLKTAIHPGEPIAMKDGKPVFKDWGTPQDDAVGLRLIATEKFHGLISKYAKYDGSGDPAFLSIFQTAKDKDAFLQTLYKAQLNPGSRLQGSLSKTDAEYLIHESLHAAFDPQGNLSGIRFPKSKDLWEETGNTPDVAHFHTNAMIFRGLNSAAKMAAAQNDPGARAVYEQAARTLASRTANEFWDPGKNLYSVHLPGVTAKPRQIDLGVLIGALDTRGELVPLTSDRLFSTVYESEKAFHDAFPINRSRALKDGLHIPRYPEDKYDGVGTSLGNPWVIGNFRWADYYYRVATELRGQSVTLSKLNSGFFNESLGFGFNAGKTLAPGSQEHQAVLDALERKADLLIQAVVESPQNTNFQKPTEPDQLKNIFYFLGEQLHRDDAKNTGSQGLTWNAAAALRAIQSWHELQVAKGLVIP